VAASDGEHPLTRDRPVERCRFGSGDPAIARAALRVRICDMPAIVLGPGDGERHPAGGASEIVIKAAGAHTAGSFFLSETTIEAGFPGPPAHRHDTLHDMFYVLAGTLTVQLDDEVVHLVAGSFVCVPPGVVHTFSNGSDTPVRFLNFNTPAGWEHYMRALGEAATAGPLTRERIGEIASRYDFRAA
jgi:quercetin dioxygenase-like cupin family protein